MIASVRAQVVPRLEILRQLLPRSKFQLIGDYDQSNIPAGNWDRVLELFSTYSDLVAADPVGVGGLQGALNCQHVPTMHSDHAHTDCNNGSQATRKRIGQGERKRTKVKTRVVAGAVVVPVPAVLENIPLGWRDGVNDEDRAGYAGNSLTGYD